MRNLTDEELVLLETLIFRRDKDSHLLFKLKKMFVFDMNDGGMGSLKFIQANKSILKAAGVFASGEFDDIDGITVLVYLYVDKNGDLFELDIWKVDSTPLLKYPKAEEIREINLVNNGQPFDSTEMVYEEKQVPLKSIDSMKTTLDLMEQAIKDDLIKIKETLCVGSGETYSGLVSINGRNVYYKVHHIREKNYLSVGKIAPFLLPGAKIGIVKKANLIKRLASLLFEAKRQPGVLRKLYDQETVLLKTLITKFESNVELLDTLFLYKVQDMNDGGMGSLKFFYDKKNLLIKAYELVFPPRFASIAIEAEFFDSDAVPVFVSIYLDQYKRLFELDMWKVDFSPLRNYPAADEIEIFD